MWGQRSMQLLLLIGRCMLRTSLWTRMQRNEQIKALSSRPTRLWIPARFLTIQPRLNTWTLCRRSRNAFKSSAHSTIMSLSWSCTSMTSTSAHLIRSQTRPTTYQALWLCLYQSSLLTRRTSQATILLSLASLLSKTRYWRWSAARSRLTHPRKSSWSPSWPCRRQACLSSPCVTGSTRSSMATTSVASTSPMQCFPALSQSQHLATPLKFGTLLLSASSERCSIASALSFSCDQR